MTIGRVLTAAGIGAGLMYLLDPDQGGRRRALVRDQLVSAANKTGDAADATSRDVRNRARGVVASLRSRLETQEDVSDDVLRERVRARVGQIVSHAAALEATVADGRVTLRGPVLADDVSRLLRRVRAVRGVKDVQCELDVHQEPGDVPGLQGVRRRPDVGQVFHLMRDAWSPAARACAGAAGALMAVWGVRRSDLLGVGLSLAGAALLTRGATNMPLRDLLGIGDERRATRRLTATGTDALGRAPRPEDAW